MTKKNVSKATVDQVANKINEVGDVRSLIILGPRLSDDHKAHLRFGHMSWPYISHLKDSDIETGLTITSKGGGKFHCPVGKYRY